MKGSASSWNGGKAQRNQRTDRWGQKKKETEETKGENEGQYDDGERLMAAMCEQSNIMPSSIRYIPPLSYSSRHATSPSHATSSSSSFSSFATNFISNPASDIPLNPPSMTDSDSDEQRMHMHMHKRTRTGMGSDVEMEMEMEIETGSSRKRQRHRSTGTVEDGMVDAAAETDAPKRRALRLMNPRELDEAIRGTLRGLAADTVEGGAILPIDVMRHILTYTLPCYDRAPASCR